MTYDSKNFQEKNAVPVPKIDKKLSGGKFGSKTNRKPIRIDFCPFWEVLGAIFQKTLKLLDFKGCALHDP